MAETNQLPHSLEAETGILGAILLDPQLYYDAAAGLCVDDLYLDSHRRIYRAMITVADELGQAIDIITLTDYLRASKQIDAMGGVAYIASLTEGLPRRENVTHYLEIVRSKSRLRQIIRACEATQQRAMEQDGAVDEILADVQNRLLEVITDDHKPKSVPLSKALDELFQYLQETRRIEKKRTAVGLRSGLDELDVITTGYHPGETTVLGGYTSHGKSSLAVQCILANLRDGVPCAVFTIEMMRRQIAARMLAAEANISPLKLRDGRLLEDMFEVNHLNEFKSKMAKWPCYLDESSNLTVDEIVSRARMHVRRDGVKLVVVDFIQLVDVPKAYNNADRLSRVAKGLRDFAKAEKVHMLALSQLTAKDREETRPHGGLLKESGDIRNLANNVVLVWRPRDEYGKFKKDEEEIIVDKQREGVIGPVKVRYNPDVLLFESRETQYHRDA